MTKKYSTKKALVASLLSLALCFSMLIGTTFAWFTDSVTSANNIIKSGNLDIEMYWVDGTEDPTNASWTDASTGAIFNCDKWEPGYVEVRHIKIANEGSLALKYKVNIVANGEVSDLADVIDVYYVDPAIQVADRATLANAPKLGTLTEVLEGLGESGNGTLEAGTADTITIALKMQESAGNEYMNKSIGSDFSIQLVATQLVSENDSFGNDYDVDATYPEIGSATIEENSGATTIKASNVSVTVPEGAETGEYKVVVTNKNTSTDANGQTTFSADISLLKDGVKVERNGETVYLVEIEVEADKNIVKILHNGNEVTDYEYDATTGIVKFETDSFSPFSVIYEENKTVKVSSAEEFLAAIADAQPGAIIDATGVSIDVNAVGSDIPGGKKAVSVPGGITIKGLSVVGSYRGGNYFKFDGGSDLPTVLEDCTFEPNGRAMGVGFGSYEGGAESIVYNNCTFKGPIILEFANNPNGVATYNNCTFTKATSGNHYVMTYGGTHLFNGCTFDYTGVTQSNMGTINAASVNATSDSDGSNFTVVVLDGCTRINCGTRQYGANSTLTIK